MAKVTGTTAVTAGLGTLVLLHVLVSWGAWRGQGQGPADISPPSPASGDLGAVLQRRSGAWRPWPAPAEPVAPAWPAPQRPVQAAAHQPDVAIAAPAEARPARDGSPPGSAAPSLPAPTGDPAALAAAPPASAPAVPKPPPAKERMWLAGPDGEARPTPPVGQDPPRMRAPAEASPSEPLGYAAVAPQSKFGPDNLKRLERNGF